MGLVSVGTVWWGIWTVGAPMGVLAGPTLGLGTWPQLQVPFTEGPGVGVEMTHTRWRELIREQEPEVMPPWAASRDLRLRVESDGIWIHGRWHLRAQGAGFFMEPLLPREARIDRAAWNGEAAGLWAGDAGVMVVGRVDQKADLEVEAFLPASSQPVELCVLGATRGRVEVSAPFPVGLRAVDDTPVLRDGARFVTGSERLIVTSRETIPADRATIAIAQVGLGLTVEDDVVTTRARISWAVRQGSLDTVVLRTKGIGPDLELIGPNVGSWAREGDLITIPLKEKAVSAVVVDLHFTTPIPRGATNRFELPIVQPQAVFRLESSLELARGGEVDAIPEVDWEPVASPELPAWGRGLVTGTATAAYRHAGQAASPGTLTLHRYEPVATPEVIVEIADLVVAATAEGRSLHHARYELKNERAAALMLLLPASARLVGVWVAGEPTMVALVDGRVRVPLPRSVEAINGLLSFPVEVVYLSEAQEWAHRERRNLELPRVFAPVQVERITMRLPRGYRSLLKAGTGSVVAGFTRGNEVAYGLRDHDRVATADALYRDALTAWNGNDFARAQTRLDQLSELGASGESQAALQANVDLVVPRQPRVYKAQGSGSLEAFEAAPATPADSTGARQARRIRAQVRARADDTRQRQRHHKQRAQELKSAGSYGEAMAEYQKALDETAQLRRFEDEEGQQYTYELDELEGELEATKREAAALEEITHSSKLWSGRGFGRAGTEVPPPPPISVVAPVAIPAAGETVLHQFVLLEPGAERTVPIRARKRREHRSR